MCVTSLGHAHAPSTQHAHGHGGHGRRRLIESRHRRAPHMHHARAQGRPGSGATRCATRSRAGCCPCGHSFCPSAASASRRGSIAGGARARGERAWPPPPAVVPRTRGRGHPPVPRMLQKGERFARPVRSIEVYREQQDFHGRPRGATARPCGASSVGHGVHAASMRIGLFTCAQRV